MTSDQISAKVDRLSNALFSCIATEPRFRWMDLRDVDLCARATVAGCL